MLRPLFLVVSLILMGVLGYHFIEQWPLLDCLYMTVITIFTVGFKEVKQLSPSGQIFTIFIILGGAGTALYAFTKIGEIVFEGGIHKFWRRRKMEKMLQNLKGNRIKAVFLVGIFMFALSQGIFAQEKASTKYFELENGLRVFLYKRTTVPLVNIAVAVNLGSKDESEETSGLVHILEHYILFRGTEFRSGSAVGRDIRSHGAYFNAHTGHDLAFFEMSLPAEYAAFALRNQKEILFNLQISQEELDKEKKIILEELSEIQDDPLRYATALVYQNLFLNHPYQKPVYGIKEIIEEATVEQVENFYHGYFVPSNCALSVVGDFDMEMMEAKVQEVFGSLENRGFSPSRFQKKVELEETMEVEKEMDVNQAYLLIGMLGPDYNHPDQYAVDLLTEILGRGFNPMLNMALRGRRKLAHSVHMQFNALKYGGSIIIYLTLDPGSVYAAKSETINFLKLTRRQNYSKRDYFGQEKFYAYDYLESSKNQMKYAFHRSQEKGLNVAVSLVRYMLLNEDQKRGKFLDDIDKISSSDLRKVAGKYLGQGKYVVVSIVPQKEE
ncbi:MAG: insulinase family protein [Candidatus Aminicenantes bacterium]